MSALGKKIIEFLSSHAKHEFPKEGIIAGQCVAEAYFRVKNIPIYTRIKDIDIFCASNHNKKDLRFKDIKKVYYKIGYSSSYVAIKSQDRGDYADEFSDVLNGTLKETVKRYKKTYKISHVFDIENLNIVILNGDYKNHSLFLKTIVDCFDINMVKIGVCLKTKEVYISDDFKEFIKNKQLEIVDKKNPFKSFLRYLTKIKYSKGIYSSCDYEANLLYSLLDLGDKKTYFKSVSFDYYSKLDDVTKKNIQKYFSVKVVEHSFLKKVKIPLNLSYVYTSNIDSTNYKIEKMINESNFVQIFYPIVDYFVPNNQRLGNDTIMEEIKKKYLLEKIIDYSNAQENKPIPDKVIAFRKKYNPYWNKKSIYIIGVNTFKTIYFTPRKRVFNQIVKHNLSFLKKRKKIKDNLYKLPLINNKDFLQMFFSKSKTSLFYSFLMKLDTKRRDCTQIKDTLDFLSKLICENKYNKIGSFLQLNIPSLKALKRHDELAQKVNSLSFYKKQELDFKALAFKFIYMEKLDISLIGYFEKSTFPLSFLIEPFEEFTIRLTALKKSLDISHENLKKVKILKIEERFLEYKTYKINQICNPIVLKEVGTEMSHCVGGYDRYLKGKMMLFFDIYTQKNERRTLSVELKKNTQVNYHCNETQDIKKIKGLKLYFNQYKGKRNLSPSKDETKDIIAFVEELSNSLNNEIYQKNPYYLEEFEIKTRYKR